MTSNQTEAGDDAGDEAGTDHADEHEAPTGDGPPDEADENEDENENENDADGHGAEADEDDEEPDDDGADAQSDEEADDDEDEDEGPSRILLVVGAAVAFVAIAIVGILIATDGGGGGGGDSGGGDTAADARTDVGIFGSIDQFDRPDSTTSLGDFAPGRPWTATAGTWGITDNEAYLVESDEFRNHAVIGMGQGDGGAQVRLDKVVNGAGLVFRYVGPYNYWAVVAVPDVATWNVIKVVEGDQEVVGNTGQSPTGDGTTVAVRLRGDTIEVIVNGRIRKTVVDEFQAEAGKVGITARGADSGDARFDDFVAGLPGGVPLGGGAEGGNSGGNGGGAGGTSTTTSSP